MSDDIVKIRDLNDRFRAGDDTVPGLMMVTTGIKSAFADSQAALIALVQTVRNYAAFTQENDPSGEHDFGAFDLNGHRIFWKIDVFDPSLEVAALDPGDPILSKRVLTIMLASEY